MEKETGGPAFPVPEITDGLTLRDYFAAKALQGELASQDKDMGVWAEELAGELAQKSYLIADAMLGARKK